MAHDLCKENCSFSNCSIFNHCQYLTFDNYHVYLAFLDALAYLVINIDILRGILRLGEEKLFPEV